VQNLILLILLTISIFGDSKIIIGGNNSFNNNNGNISIQQSNSISKMEREIDTKIAKNIKESNILLGLLQKAKKINKIKTSPSDKERRCKNQVDALLNLFGHKFQIGYDKCKELFN